MALVLAAPLAVLGLLDALAGGTVGVPLLLVSDLVGRIAGRLGTAVFVEVLALLLAGWGMAFFAGRPPRAERGRWLPVAGLVGGAVGGGLLAGGLGLLYGMIGGAALGGFFGRVAGGSGPKAGILLEVLRCMSLALAGLWLLGHLL